MHSISRIVFTFLIFLVITTLTSAQEDGGGSPDSSQLGESRSELRMPQLNVRDSEQDTAIYVAELRYRMIWQMIGFIALLGVLHFVQVKLKIPRAQFWFTVVVVFAGLVLSSYRKTSPSSHSPSDAGPTYAPTHAR